MRIKTSELEGKALDYVVAQIDPFCEGLEWRQVAGGLARVGYGKIDGAMMPCAYLSHGASISEKMRMRRDGVEPYSPSTDWSRGGPIMEKRQAAIDYARPLREGERPEWMAQVWQPYANAKGETMLIAACRAIVAAELGDEVDVPDELVEKANG